MCKLAFENFYKMKLFFTYFKLGIKSSKIIHSSLDWTEILAFITRQREHLIWMCEVDNQGTAKKIFTEWGK